MDVKKCDRCGSIFNQSLRVKDKISVEYHYIINFNPKMWIPYSVDYID